MGLAPEFKSSTTPQLCGEEKGNNSADLLVVVWGLNATTCVKCLEQCLTHKPILNHWQVLPLLVLRLQWILSNLSYVKYLIQLLAFSKQEFSFLPAGDDKESSTIYNFAPMGWREGKASVGRVAMMCHPSRGLLRIRNMLPFDRLPSLLNKVNSHCLPSCPYSGLHQQRSGWSRKQCWRESQPVSVDWSLIASLALTLFDFPLSLARLRPWKFPGYHKSISQPGLCESLPLCGKRCGLPCPGLPWWSPKMASSTSLCAWRGEFVTKCPKCILT